MPSAGARSSGAFAKEDNGLSLINWAASDTGHAAAMPGALVTPRTADVSFAKSDALLGAILASLNDDKAEDIVQIDLRGKSEIGDHMVICSGRSSRQVAAISEKLTDRLKESFGVISKVEGKGTGDWVLIDAGDVIVHVFRPEVRDFYQLEKMWQPAPQAAASR